jgi:hypothetical protein
MVSGRLPHRGAACTLLHCIKAAFAAMHHELAFPARLSHRLYFKKISVYTLFQSGRDRLFRHIV